MCAFPHVLGESCYWCRRQEREGQLRSAPCLSVSTDAVEEGELPGTDSPSLSQEGAGDRAARPSLCFCV